MKSNSHLSPHVRAIIPRARGGGRPLKTKANATLEDDNSTYTPEEVEFMVAMDRYKRENRRPFPTWSEVFNVFKSLGYQKERTTIIKPYEEEC